MTDFHQVLPEIWREACRPIEISDALPKIKVIIGQILPVAGIRVYRMDLARNCMETAATTDFEPPRIAERWRLDFKPGQMEKMVAWARCGEVLNGTAREINATIAGLAAPRDPLEFYVAPLSNADGPSGILVVTTEPRTVHKAQMVETVAALLEPFSAALENDARLRELNAHREAAEADKQSLLNRLGRQDLAETIVGAERGLRHVLERVQLVARSDAPVLIFGETGSGKEVIARAIHTRSPRVARPFHRVNCGAMPAELIDSELFGHERGSFTGAIALRKGWFERADGGTLFLDEIGELPPAAQVRLLRILQDGRFERVGGQKQLSVDVRIVGATHRNLQAMVADGRFREDLWYRLAVFPIHLPSLREHVEDIPDLATHFALKAARRFGTPPLTPTPEDFSLLLAYSWPGNVRELQSVLERAVILGNGGHLDVARALGATGPVPVVSASGPHRTSPSDHDPNEFVTLETVVRRHIEAALERCQGRVEGASGAARLLKINPHTLRARMRKLRIDWKRFRVSAVR